MCIPDYRLEITGSESVSLNAEHVLMHYTRFNQEFCTQTNWYVV